jgi:hypothetical protein
MWVFVGCVCGVFVDVCVRVCGVFVYVCVRVCGVFVYVCVRVCGRARVWFVRVCLVCVHIMKSRSVYSIIASRYCKQIGMYLLFRRNILRDITEHYGTLFRVYFWSFETWRGFTQPRQSYCGQIFSRSMVRTLCCRLYLCSLYFVVV